MVHLVFSAGLTRSGPHDLNLPMLVYMVTDCFHFFSFSTSGLLKFASHDAFISYSENYSLSDKQFYFSKNQTAGILKLGF